GVEPSAADCGRPAILSDCVPAASADRRSVGGSSDDVVLSSADGRRKGITVHDRIVSASPDDTNGTAVCVSITSTDAGGLAPVQDQVLAAPTDSRVVNARSYTIGRRASDDVREASRRRLDSQRTYAVHLHLEILVIRGAEVMRARRGARVATQRPNAAAG